MSPCRPVFSILLHCTAPRAQIGTKSKQILTRLSCRHCNVVEAKYRLRLFASRGKHSMLFKRGLSRNDGKARQEKDKPNMQWGWKNHRTADEESSCPDNFSPGPVFFSAKIFCPSFSSPAFFLALIIHCVSKTCRCCLDFRNSFIVELSG